MLYNISKIQKQLPTRTVPKTLINYYQPNKNSFTDSVMSIFTSIFQSVCNAEDMKARDKVLFISSLISLCAEAREFSDRDMTGTRDFTTSTDMK